MLLWTPDLLKMLAYAQTVTDGIVRCLLTKESQSHAPHPPICVSPPRPCGATPFEIRISSLIRISNFEFRISNFEFKLSGFSSMPPNRHHTLPHRNLNHQR